MLIEYDKARNRKSGKTLGVAKADVLSFSWVSRGIVVATIICK